MNTGQHKHQWVFFGTTGDQAGNYHRMYRCIHCGARIEVPHELSYGR